MSRKDRDRKYYLKNRERILEKKRLYMKLYRQRPEVKRRRYEWQKKYFKTSKGEEVLKKYKQGEVYKSYRKEYTRRGEVRQRMKEYGKRPEVKEYQKQYYLQHKNDRRK